jgi:hypothetical protein
LCDPAASLDVFVAAAQHVRDPERASTAADAHTSRRTALHFAERVLNASMQELEASFAAAIVLDEPSSRASEPVTFISAWDFTRVARAAVCAGPSALMWDAALGPPSVNGVDSDDGEDGGCGGSASAEADLSGRDYAAANGGLSARYGYCRSHTDMRGVRRAISDAQHYAYRPSELAPLNAMEYVLRFKVEKAVTPADIKFLEGERERAEERAAACAAVAAAAAASELQPGDCQSLVGVHVCGHFVATPRSHAARVPVGPAPHYLLHGDAPETLKCSGAAPLDGAAADALLLRFHEAGGGRAAAMKALEDVGAGRSRCERVSVTCKVAAGALLAANESGQGGQLPQPLADGVRVGEEGRARRAELLVSGGPRQLFAAVELKCHDAPLQLLDGWEGGGVPLIGKHHGCVVGRAPGGVQWVVRWQDGNEAPLSEAAVNLLAVKPGGAAAGAPALLAGRAVCWEGAGGVLHLGRLEHVDDIYCRTCSCGDDGEEGDVARARLWLQASLGAARRVRAVCSGGQGESAQRAGAGRPALRFGLLPAHPLAGDHLLKEAALWGTPALAGAPPPQEPHSDASDAQKDAFARYHTALFVPWSVDKPPALSWAGWTGYVERMESEASLKMPLPPGAEVRAAGDAAAAGAGAARPLAATRRIVAHGRLCAIAGASAGTVARDQVGSDVNHFRLRCRTLWGDDGAPTFGAAGAAWDGGDEDARAAVAEARERLRRSSQRRSVATRVGAAARLSDWLNGMRSVPAPAGGDAGRRALARQWQAAANPKRRAALDQELVASAKARNCTCPGDGERASDVLASGGAAGSTGGAGAGGAAVGTVGVPSGMEAVSESQWRTLHRAYKENPPHLRGAPPLNVEQRAIAREVYGNALSRRRGQWSGGGTLVVGAAGTGKSALVHALQRACAAAGLGPVVVTAYTGVAAAPFLGPTAVSLFSLGGLISKRADGADACSARLQDFTQADISKMRTRFREESGFDVDSVSLLVVDEATFVSAAMFGHVERRLRAMLGVAAPWGGLPVLLTGDAFQRSCPGATPWHELLAASSLEVGTGVLRRHGYGAQAAGIGLLRALPRRCLLKNMRSEGDLAFQAVLEQMRRTGVLRPFPRCFFDKLKPLSAADVASDPLWSFAPIAVLSNAERTALNLRQARSFAKHFGVAFVRWRLPLTKKSAASIGCLAKQQQLYEDEEDLWGYFVEGAPVILTENIRSARGLVNGAPGLLDSLDFGGAAPPEYEAALQPGFCEITLEAPPVHVCIRVGSTQGDDTHTWHGVPLADLSCCAGSAVSGEQIVPIPVSARPLKIVTQGLYSSQQGLDEVHFCRSHAFTLAFALTDYKLQVGRVRGRVLRCNARSPYPPPPPPTCRVAPCRGCS